MFQFEIPLTKIRQLAKQEDPLTRDTVGNAIVEIDYTNWKGDRSLRNVIPCRIYFGSNYYHPKKQWLMVAWDLDKNEERTFAMEQIYSFKPFGTADELEPGFWTVERIKST